MSSRGDLGARLATAIDHAGKSQKWLASELGVSQAAVSEWARGVDKLCAVPDALGINGHWLLTGKGQIDPPEAATDLEAERAAVVAEYATKLEAALLQTVREVTGSGGGSFTLTGRGTATVRDATEPTASPAVGLARTQEILAETEVAVPPPKATPARQGRRKRA